MEGWEPRHIEPMEFPPAEELDEAIKRGALEAAAAKMLFGWRAPRWDWLYFYVEHVRPGLVRLDHRFFFSHGIVWRDHEIEQTNVFLPMENRAQMVVCVMPFFAFYMLCYFPDQEEPDEDSSINLEPMRGRLQRKPGEPSPQGVESVEAIQALLRQFGSMEVAL